MGNACVKTFNCELMFFFNIILTSFLALVVFCGKCMCQNSQWCVDVFIDFIAMPFLASVVFGGKSMRQNSQWCVHIFFRVIFGVSALWSTFASPLQQLSCSSYPSPLQSLRMDARNGVDNAYRDAAAESDNASEHRP